MKQFKVGETVYSIRSGKGKVVNIDRASINNNYVVEVKFKNDYNTFTKDGRYYIKDLYPELYHKPIRVVKKKKYKCVNITDIPIINSVIYASPKPTLIFKQFLIDNGIEWDKFVENCRIENQRWEVYKHYYGGGIIGLSTFYSERWIRRAFDWGNSICSSVDKINKLDDKWYVLATKYKRNGWTIRIN